MGTTYTVTHDFNADTTAVADYVDANFTCILNAINALDAGNLASGTVALARISGLTSTQCAAAFFKDEDSFASASATNVYSGESIKAYVDTQDAVADDNAFGTWTNKDSGASALVKDEVYKVGSDGFVLVFSPNNDQRPDYTFLTDSANPPTTVRQKCRNLDGNNTQSICIPIKKDDYWKLNDINTFGSISIHWLPIGSGTCVKQ